ncbi:MAG TPA: histidine kinase dimerization/phospho-acceptor domain-containing protein, partial [Holophagaceae bacterium]
MRPAFTRTLRFRLTLWHSLFLMILFLAFAGVTYAIVQRNLLRHHDGSLREAAGQVLQILSEQPDCAHLTADQVGRLDEVGRLLLIHQDEGRHTTFYESPEMKATPLARQLTGEPWKDQAIPWFSSYEGAHGPIRVFSFPYETRTGRKGIIRVLEDMGEIVPILASFRKTLLLLFPLGIGLAAAGGYWLSGRAMAPVERVTAMSRAIEASSLHQRLPHPGVDCEIGRLVDTLNHMLGRLDDSFGSMARFTADASHELRSPLANLRSLVDVSLRDPHSREELQEDIQSIGEEVDRLGRIVEDLLLMAKADADRLPLRLEELRLDQLAESQAEAFAGRAEEAGL